MAGIERIPACAVKGCPWPKSPEQHVPWCGHGLEGHHHHVPKRSQGGKRIVAFLCPACHDEVDNGISLGNMVWKDMAGTEHYLLWDVAKGNLYPLIDTVLAAAPASQEAQDPEATRRYVPPPRTPKSDTESAQDPEAKSQGEAESAAAVGDDVRVDRRTGSIPAAAPSASPLSPAEEGQRFLAADDEPQGSGREVGQIAQPSSAAPSFFPVSSETGDYCRRGMWLMFLALRLQKMTTETAFEIGDWVNEGENALGEAAHQFFGVFSYWQIATWASVARRVPELCRHNELPFGHHQAVASLPETEQGEMLAAAVQGRWKRERLREAVSGPSEPQERHECPECGQNHVVRRVT